MVWIDAHCHPQFVDKDLRTEKLESWRQHWLLGCSTSLEDYNELHSFTHNFPNFISSIGWHPWYITENNQVDCDAKIETIGEIASKTRCPIGEIGLDFHPKWRSTSLIQSYIFERLCQIAVDLDLPIIVHCVRAHHEILRILKRMPKLKIYLHGFKGTLGLVDQYKPYDIYFGCSILHFSNLWNRLYEYIDFKRILFESDDLLYFSTYKESIESFRPAVALLPEITSNFAGLLEKTNTKITF